MTKKLGRNEKCWCGSGIKYKKCHLNRESQDPIPPQDGFKVVKDFNKIKRCSVPNELHGECKRKIIKAHTVSKSSSLKEIAENGHVLGIKQNLESFIKNNGKMMPELIGINQASTFTGFCSKHDKEIFSPIEDYEFTSTPEQCFCLTYRPVCREIYVKESMPGFIDFMKKSDMGLDKADQLLTQFSANNFQLSNDLTTKDLGYIKSKLDEMLVRKEYSNLIHHIILLKEPPKIMASVALALQFDVMGKQIQTLDKSPDCPDYTVFNSFSSDGNGYFIISSLDEHKKTTGKFVTSLLSLENHGIGEAITRFIVSYCENFYISPKWWGGIDDKMQENLIKRVHYGVDEQCPDDALVSDGVVFNAINFKEYRIVH